MADRELSRNVSRDGMGEGRRDDAQRYDERRGPVDVRRADEQRDEDALEQGDVRLGGMEQPRGTDETRPK